MPLFGKTFTYNNTISSDIIPGLVLGSMDTMSGDDLYLERTPITGEISQSRPIANQYGSKYSSTLSFNVSVMKEDQTVFSQSELRALNSWLTSPKRPAAFSIQACNNEITYYNDIIYYCTFTSVSDYRIGNPAILTYSAICNAPYGFSKPTDYKYSSNTSLNFTIDNTSDELEEYLYPLLIFSCKTTGEIKLNNKSDSLGTLILNMHKDQTITLDSKNGLIYDDRNAFDFSQDFNLVYPRLLPGANSLSLSGHADLTIRCQFPRKVGV